MNVNLNRLDVEVDGGESFEVLFEETLRVVLSDLLPRHLVRSHTQTQTTSVIVVTCDKLWW